MIGWFSLIATFQPLHVALYLTRSTGLLIWRKVVPGKRVTLPAESTSASFDPFARANSSPPPGGGVLPYICLIGICRLKGYGFCAVLVWNGGVDFACFALNSGMVFDGSAWTCLSFQFQMDKKERVICEFEMDFQKYFCWHSKLSNDDIISAYARSENGSGF